MAYAVRITKAIKQPVTAAETAAWIFFKCTCRSFIKNEYRDAYVEDEYDVVMMGEKKQTHQLVEWLDGSPVVYT